MNSRLFAEVARQLEIAQRQAFTQFRYFMGGIVGTAVIDDDDFDIRQWVDRSVQTFQKPLDLRTLVQDGNHAR